VRFGESEWEGASVREYEGNAVALTLSYSHTLSLSHRDRLEWQPERLAA
jgi:hypothetical protein